MENPYGLQKRRVLPLILMTHLSPSCSSEVAVSTAARPQAEIPVVHSNNQPFLRQKAAVFLAFFFSWKGSRRRKKDELGCAYYCEDPEEDDTVGVTMLGILREQQEGELVGVAPVEGLGEGGIGVEDAHLGPDGGGFVALRREREQGEGDDEHRQAVPHHCVGLVDCGWVI